jgi:NADPH-dependent glutamate synthase beta subunit-like oxidoreductase
VEIVVTAIGYNVDPEWGEAAQEMTRDRWGRLVVDPETMETNLPGVFAGGDDVNGADLVVTALADAHRAAEAIDRYLDTLVVLPPERRGPLVGDSSFL